jgi:hypothetical protein
VWQCKLSQSQQQYWDVKSKYRDVILFFKIGKFYELYEEDAQIGQDELGWKLTVSGVGHCRQVRLQSPDVAFVVPPNALSLNWHLVARSGATTRSLTVLDGHCTARWGALSRGWKRRWPSWWRVDIRCETENDHLACSEQERRWRSQGKSWTLRGAGGRDGPPRWDSSSSWGLRRRPSRRAAWWNGGWSRCAACSLYTHPSPVG